MPKDSRITVPVTPRAVIQRINRKLKPDDRMLRTARSPRVEQDLGRYFIVNFNRNRIVEQHVDLEDLGRELGVLAAYEHVVGEA
jgi:hypothetical protein